MKDIAIGIKTFLRDEHLTECIRGLNRTFPDAQLIIADDGTTDTEKLNVYVGLQREGHIVKRLPFDSGFGAKSNAIVSSLEYPYLLIGSDDFDFRPAEVREGVERLKEVLDYFPEVDIASGRVNNNPYEFNWLEPEPGVLEEVPIDYTNYNVFKPWFTEADLTANYSLIRARVFDKVRWDEDVKIGGAEHASFFLDCKRANLKTVWVPDVNINEIQIRNSREYSTYRRRADSPERPCFVKRGVRKYTLADGRVDHEYKG